MLGVIDIRDQLKGRKRKWYANKRSQKIGLCLHHTAVKGGFGTHKSRRKLYEGKPQSFTSWLVNPRRPLSDDEYVKIMALAHRYRGDPATKHNGGVAYHAILSAPRIVYLNLPFDLWSWHGNGANEDYLGVAWDALSSGEGPDVCACREALRFIIRTARAEGHPISKLTCHSAWTNKPSDPGAEFIREVMEPVARGQKCSIDYDFKDKNSAKSMRETLEAG